MKVVILAGGFGTRLSELTGIIPKPMALIGNDPIIIHIMNYYAAHGHKDFIVDSKDSNSKGWGFF